MNGKFARWTGVLLLSAAGTWVLAHGNQPGMAKLAVPGGEIVIDYVAPALNGRQVMEMLKQPGANPWRLGADKPTTLATPVDLNFGEGVLGAGKYVLRAYLDEDGAWWLQAYDQARQVVGKLSLESSTAGEPKEHLEIALAGSVESAKIHIQWGTQVLAGAFSAAD